ncbi:MAG: Crp/Fnr family transcriptional regulator [Alphaproteobacteria bacterium]|nr:Crp/Fnr family transcriptional regulator [Alphaproteobacteria bacterium]MBV8549543.1 Crp/Fnr family transcriptional regulator [Alphaproteobacteria bacterium]
MANDIADLPLFAGMEPQLLNGLLASSRVVEHNKGEVIIEQSQHISRCYVILSGWCGISKTNQNGQESIIQLLTRGDFLPEPDMIQRENSPFNIQALSPVRLLMTPPTIINNALQQSPVFARNMLMAMGRRVQDTRDHVEQLTLRTAEERVGRFLLQIRHEVSDHGEEFDLPFSKNIIAAYLGIKPETLSRTLQMFKAQGIKIDQAHIKLPNQQSLCDFCDSTVAQKCSHANEADCPNPAYPA